MAKITGVNQEWDAPYAWHVYKVEMDLADDGATGTVDVAIDTIPIGSEVLDCKVIVTTAEAGATSSALDVEVGAATLYDTGADSLGTLTAYIAPTAAEILASSAVSRVTGGALNCEVTIVGTMTTAPVFTLAVLGGRVSY